ncbi:hypothetical protein [Methylobacterium isbiliense]|jgi:hypothetical protein|uniref:Uncharacterized protein n=1 Tax=Methylobacterium isbiliense TaxID=315478 RepID=A0ABQ4SKA7_9HYPH|nr:hypothetical protein [Methylobacterium isbiliense]MDN3626783.1 hypothetical protein [Methylobacterium isbiliense]GJE02178.1 hypothetical protein GMJLKIPL_4122 [Methylobacterium isbiliense]
MSGAAEPPLLPSEWCAVAESAAANLGLGRDLPKLSAEHWQKVLAAVEARMRLKGADLPANWREQLSRQAGRSEAIPNAASRPQSASVRVLDGRMSDVDSLVARYVREAHTIASAMRMVPASEPTDRVLEWAQIVKQHADTMPDGQGPALLARIARRLRDLAASAAKEDDQREHILQLLALRLDDKPTLG